MPLHALDSALLCTRWPTLLSSPRESLLLVVFVSGYLWDGWSNGSHSAITRSRTSLICQLWKSSPTFFDEVN